MISDEKILDLYRARSEEAIEETRRAYGGLLRHMARNLLGSREDAEEVENEVYLAAWQQIPPARPLPFLPYLKTICRRRALKRLEARTALKRGGGEAPLLLEELEESLPGGEDGRRWAGRISLKEAIDGFLEALSETDRRIFLQRYWYFLPIEQLARENGLRQDQTKLRLYRLRQRLKKHLEREGLWDE